MADLIVNHVSSRSPQFADFRKRGDASSYAFMFLTYGACFPDGATEAELLQIYRPRPGLPFTKMRLDDGTRATLVDYVHLRTSGYRRSFPAGQKVPG